MFYDEQNTLQPNELVPGKRIAPAWPPPTEVVWKNHKKNLGIQFFRFFDQKSTFSTKWDIFINENFFETDFSRKIDFSDHFDQFRQHH